MVSTHSNTEKKKQREPFEKLAESVNSKTEDVSCLMDNLPVTVFKSSSKLSWSMDYISTNVEKLTGYSKIDFIDQKLLWSDIVFPEDITTIDKAVKKAKKNKSSYQIEYRIKKADGSTAFIQEQAHLVCDDSGKLAYIAGVFLDLTSEVKRRENSHDSIKEERIQLEMLRSFVESLSRGDIPDPITDNNNGDFNEIKNNLNNCIEGLQGLVECNNVLHRMALNDHTKGVKGDHVGIFASMGEATNEVRDRLLSVTGLMNEIAVGDTSQLMEFKKIGKRSEQDHLLPAMIQAMENINLLIEDTGILSKAAVEGKLDIRADASKHYGEYRKTIQGVNDTLDAVVGPLNVAAEYVERISRGDIPEPITDNYNGDFNEIKNNLNTCIDAINNLVEDSLTLSGAGVAGQLDTRADATRHEGNFRWIVNGMNDTLDAVVGPLNVAAEYVERISRGEIPEPITDDYNGDFNEIKNNLNSCIDGLQGLLECNNVLHSMASNDHTKGVEGNHVGIFASMGKATNEVRERLVSVTGLMNEIAVGDTSQLMEFKKIGKRSEQDHLLPAMIQAMENINLLIEDTGMLSKAAVEGKLDTRADASKHKGEYRKVVEGVNDTLDAVIGPLNVAAEYVERISRGDIPEPIMDNYNGDFNEIKNNLNTCIDAVNNLIEDSIMLSEAGVSGKLDIRADATRHQGYFRGIIEGVNDTLDAVIGPLNVAAEYVERIGRGDIPEPITDNYNGDFNEIKNNLNNCIEGLQGLVECNNVLHRMALNDHTKGVEGNHVGIFASMGEATNDVRDRLLSVNSLINDIAVGNTSQLEKFKKIGRRSEQDMLVPAFIQAMENVNLLLEDAGMLSRAALEGKLDIRADASKHYGEYRKTIQGVNDTLDAVVGPLNVAAEYVERISRGDIPEPITDNYNGDFNEIKNNLNTCIDAINNLIEDSLMLSEAGVAGQLDTRADATRHEGSFRRIVNGMNATLDAVIGPLNVAAEYVERISLGDIPEPITDNYNGDFNEIKNNLNKCIAAVNNLIEDSLMLSEAGVEGKLDTRADATRHEGDFRKIIEGVNNTLDAVVGYINRMPLPVVTIDKSFNIRYINETGSNLVGSTKKELIGKKCYSQFKSGDCQTQNCASARAMERISETKSQTLAKPMGKEFEIVHNSLPIKNQNGEVTGAFQFYEDQTASIRVANYLNNEVEKLKHNLDKLSNGDTDLYINVSEGDEYTIEARKNFTQINEKLAQVNSTIKNLVADAGMLSYAARNGELDTRADASKHPGDFRRIVEGFNDTLDAVIGPLNVAAEYVERISRGDVPELITDNYNGDFNELKNNLNTCIIAIDNLVEDAIMLSEAGVAGKLDTRADATKHEGDFRKIVEGVNDTLDAVIGPVNEAIRVSNEFSNGNFRARIDENLHVEGDFINFKRVLNNIGISVSEIIKSAKFVTMQVAEHSDEASKGADDVAKASEGVAMSSQKSSELIRELLYKIEGINREIVDLSVSNEKIADSSKGILSAANEVVRIGKDAQVLGRDTNLKMGSVEKIAKESVDGINSLTEQIKQIDGIVQLINDITSQINLLSLNAAIEAARAGEHGRGFAVVAGEVKNLATKARNATETIENVVSSVQRDSKKTADAINTANSEIIDGVNSVNKTLDALNTIIKNATQVTEDIGDIAKAIENQAKISMKVVTASEDGNDMTREVQKEAEGLAAIAQETSASVQEIGAAIHEVTGLSGRLKSELEVYMV